MKQITEGQVLKAIYESGLHQDASRIMHTLWNGGIVTDVPNLSLMNFVGKIAETIYADHEAAIAKAVADEREAIVQYIIGQGTIKSKAGTDVYFVTDDDIDAIRQRGK